MRVGTAKATRAAGAPKEDDDDDDDDDEGINVVKKTSTTKKRPHTALYDEYDDDDSDSKHLLTRRILAQAHTPSLGPRPCFPLMSKHRTKMDFFLDH